MKNILFLVVFFIVQNSFAMTFFEEWTSNYSLNLKVSCDKNEAHLCAELCSLEHETYNCTIPQTICRDCIGTSLKVTDIFENMGTKYKNKGTEVNYYNFIDFIKSVKIIHFMCLFFAKFTF